MLTRAFPKAIRAVRVSGTVADMDTNGLLCKERVLDGRLVAIASLLGGAGADR